MLKNDDKTPAAGEPETPSERPRAPVGEVLGSGELDTVGGYRVPQTDNHETGTLRNTLPPPSSPASSSASPASSPIEYEQQEEIFVPSRFDLDIPTMDTKKFPLFKGSPRLLEICTTKKFFSKKNISPDVSVRDIANCIVEWFLQPLHGEYTEAVFEKKDMAMDYLPEENPLIKKIEYKAPIPLLVDIANIMGFTEKELLALAEDYPDTIGRAVLFARDRTKSGILHEECELSPAASSLIASNETTLLTKSSNEKNPTTQILNLKILVNKLQNEL